MSPFEPAIGATLRDTRTRRKIDLARGRVGDEDPRPLPAGARERGVGRAARAAPTRAASSAPTRPTSASTASGSPTTTGASSSRRRRSARRATSRCRRRRPPAAGRALGRGSRGGALAGLISVGLIAILIAIGLLSGDSDDDSRQRPRRQEGQRSGKPRDSGAAEERSRGDAAARWPRPTSGSVWSTPRATTLIAAQISPPAPRRAPSARGRFTVSFGNGSVRCRSTEGRPRLEDTPEPGRLRIAARWPRSSGPIAESGPEA